MRLHSVCVWSNVEVTGAARSYSVTSAWTAGLGAVDSTGSISKSRVVTTRATFKHQLRQAVHIKPDVMCAIRIDSHTTGALYGPEIACSTAFYDREELVGSVFSTCRC